MFTCEDEPALKGLMHVTNGINGSSSLPERIAAASVAVVVVVVVVGFIV